jgi:hypothetical protein
MAGIDDIHKGQLGSVPIEIGTSGARNGSVDTTPPRQPTFAALTMAAGAILLSFSIIKDERCVGATGKRYVANGSRNVW